MRLRIEYPLVERDEVIVRKQQEEVLQPKWIVNITRGSRGQDTNVSARNQLRGGRQNINTTHDHEEFDHSPGHLVKLRAANTINIPDTRKSAILNMRLVQQSFKNGPATLAPHDIPRSPPKEVKAFYGLGPQKKDRLGWLVLPLVCI